jgi:hypothetical protein
LVAGEQCLARHLFDEIATRDFVVRVSIPLSSKTKLKETLKGGVTYQILSKLLPGAEADRNTIYYAIDLHLVQHWLRRRRYRNGDVIVAFILVGIYDVIDTIAFDWKASPSPGPLCVLSRLGGSWSLVLVSQK